MKPSNVVPIVVLLLVIVGVGGYALGKSHAKTGAANPVNPTVTTNNAKPVQVSKSVTSNLVNIAGNKFDPASLTVKKGTTIIWGNLTTGPQTVTESDGQAGGPNSPQLAPSQTYSFKFDKTGTFKYHSTVQPSLTGTVTVTN